MKFIFVVDDNDYKRNSIVASLKRLYPEAHVLDFRYANEFLRDIRDQEKRDVPKDSQEYLVITDMMMPFLQGGDIKSDAGYHVLKRLDYWEYTWPVIVVSSEDIDEDMARRCYKHYVGFLLYHYGWDHDEDFRRIIGSHLMSDRKVVRSS